MHISLSYSGGSPSMQTLLQGLHDRCDTLQSTIYRYRPEVSPKPPKESAIEVNQIRKIPKLSWVNSVFMRTQWSDYFRGALSTDTEVILTQGNVAPVCVSTANEREIPVIYFVRSLIITGYEEYDFDTNAVNNFLTASSGAKLQYPFLRQTVQAHKQAIRNADMVVANSTFVADQIERRYGITPEIIYPPIKFEEYRVDSPGEKILMVNPRTKYKGGDIFLDIAQACPDEEFLVVGKCHTEMKPRMEKLENVAHINWCNDMKKVYSMAKVVVVPSRYDEPFGRVAAEPMVSGIPVVVSARGGLPEVVGEAGEVVREIDSVNEWKKAIERALNQDNSAELQQQVKQFKARRQVDNLVSIIAKVLPGKNTTTEL